MLWNNFYTKIYSVNYLIANKIDWSSDCSWSFHCVTDIFEFLLDWIEMAVNNKKTTKFSRIIKNHLYELWYVICISWNNSSVIHYIIWIRVLCIIFSLILFWWSNDVMLKQMLCFRSNLVQIVRRSRRTIFENYLIKRITFTALILYGSNYMIPKPWYYIIN